MLRKLLAFLIVVTSISLVTAQQVDSFEQAQILVNQGKYEQAIVLLKPLCQQNGHVHAKLLLAKTYYWNGEFKKSDSTYKSSIAENLNNIDLKKSYGQFLFERGKFTQAKNQLSSYFQSDSMDVLVLETLGYIYFWEEEYYQSLSMFQAIIRQDPNHENAHAMIAKISAIIKPVIRLKYFYFNDSQPLSGHRVKTSIGKYRNRFIFPQFEMDILQFTTEEIARTVPWFKIKNRITMFGSKTKLNFSLGAIQNGFSKITGDLNLDQQLAKSLTLQLNFNRNPYFFTASSISTPVFLLDMTQL
jgi:tetratricopeptide (TPR) repeat protein